MDILIKSETCIENYSDVISNTNVKQFVTTT
jgi:hypothetical protein